MVSGGRTPVAPIPSILVPTVGAASAAVEGADSNAACDARRRGSRCFVGWYRDGERSASPFRSCLTLMGWPSLQTCIGAANMSARASSETLVFGTLASRTIGALISC